MSAAADYLGKDASRTSSITVWLDVQSPASPTRKRRQHPIKDAVIQFCLRLKCLFALPFRRILGLVDILPQLAGTQ